MPKLTARFVFTNPWHFLACGFGSGMLPKAPGTWGTIAAMPIYFFMAQLSLVHYCLLLGVFFLLGIYCCQVTSEHLGVHDHGGIVWDEIVGYLITMIAVPMTPINAILGFVLFRVFDILKPWPIKILDKKVGGGFGIMVDDVMAGIMAWALLMLVNSL